MHIELEEAFVHATLTPAGLRLSVFLSNYLDNDLDDLFESWSDGEDESSLGLAFRLSSALYTMIEMHEMPAFDGAIDEHARPIFDAMRSEAKAIIDRIDALKFASCEHP